MSRPQQPELNRSGRTPVDPDHDHTVARESGQPEPGRKGQAGPIPEANRPGHHEARESDQPDKAAFARRFGIVPESLHDPAVRVGKFVARFTTVPYGYARGAVRGVRRRAGGEA